MRVECPFMSSEDPKADAKTLIEIATRNMLEEVPALKPMKLIVGIDLRGRGDTQQYRLELPEIKVTKDIAADSRVRVDIPRAFFNVMATDGKLADWREAFMYGQAKASGVEQYLKLITQVVEKQEERNRTKRARQHG